MTTVTVNTRRGPKTITTDLSPRQAYDLLAAKPEPSEFESDLIKAAQKYGDDLTPGRQNWMIVLAEEGRTRQSSTPTYVGDFGVIRDLFDRARQHLKHPKIKLDTACGRRVVLSMAGERSRYAGTISVTTGEPFGTHGSFFGRIDMDGTTSVRDGAVVDLLTRFAADPAVVAAEFGRASGNCCFCQKSLSNSGAGSAAIGYGPTCAQNYALPWSANGKEWDLREGAPVAESIAS